MNVWLDITSEVFKGGRQIYIQMKAYVQYYIIFEFGLFIHTLKSLRVHLGLIQWKQFNTIHCEEIKINMNVWLGITLEVRKGGLQIYIQIKAYVLPFSNIIPFFNLPNFFIP